MSDEMGSHSNTSFIFGLLSVVLCPLLGPIALNMCNEERKDYLLNDRPVPGLLMAGWVLSIIGTIQLVLIGLYVAFVMLLMCSM